MPMVTILVKVVTYPEGLSPIKSDDPLIIWFYDFDFLFYDL